MPRGCQAATHCLAVLCIGLGARMQIPLIIKTHLCISRVVRACLPVVACTGASAGWFGACSRTQCGLPATPWQSLDPDPVLSPASAPCPTGQLAVRGILAQAPVMGAPASTPAVSQLLMSKWEGRDLADGVLQNTSALQAIS